MANFNPVERGSLMDLMSALEGNLGGEAGWTVLQSILGQQRERVDERRARMGSLTDMLGSQALAGQSYEGAQALAEAYAPNMPPRIENTLESLYPEMESPISDIGASPVRQSPAYIDPSEAVPVTPQDQLAQLDLQDRIAEMQTAPTIANAFAERAVGFMQAGQTVPDIVTGLYALPEFTGLSPSVQSTVIAAVSARLAEEQEKIAQQAMLQDQAQAGSPFVQTGPLAGGATPAEQAQIRQDITGNYG